MSRRHMKDWKSGPDRPNNGGGRHLDAPPPRLMTRRMEKKEQDMRDELSNAKVKAVSLPVFRFMTEDLTSDDPYYENLKERA